MINYIEDLIPNLKLHGESLTTKIFLLHHNFSIDWEMVGGYYPGTIRPTDRDIFNLCMGLWADFGDYYAFENCDVNNEDDAINQ